jgi:DinB family protein
VPRSRAWVLTRRFTHSAHHRGQLMVYLRLWGQAVYSTYGPTADTGGLFQNGARVIYRDGAASDPKIPVATDKPLTERPDISRDPSARS